MKTGYSLLIGEHIAAHSIDYSDCKTFQIVCPCCKEPIFKCVRTIPPPEKHYLSHYEKDKAYAAECELRVASLDPKQLEAADILSRGQKLEYFLSVLKEAILLTLSRMHVFVRKGEDPAKTIRAIINSSGPQRMRDVVQDNFAREAKDPEVLEHRLTYILKFWTERGFELHTSFALETQKRIVRDVFLHLLSTKAQKNFTFLFGAAYLSQISAAIQAIEGGNPDKNWDLWWAGMTSLIGAGRSKADRIIEGLSTTRANDVNLLEAIVHGIAQEMIFILWTIPYFELLKTKNETDSING